MAACGLRYAGCVACSARGLRVIVFDNALTAHEQRVTFVLLDLAMPRDIDPDVRSLDGVALRDLGEHRLKDLQRPERIFQLVAPGLRADFPPLRTLEARRHNLPVQPTVFVGRRQEIEVACDLLRRPHARVLTLTGPGGVGKTRLSLQVAADSVDEYADGVFFVELAALPSPELVVPTLAKTLGVQERPGRPLAETLEEHLAEKRLLLVLDNFEHVLAAAPHVGALLVRCPGVKVLVTSREALRLSGEQQFSVPPMAAPGPSAHLPSIDQLSRYDAVRLFVERARTVKPDFAVSGANASAVVEICRRLDGLPLAIELAAAWLRTLTPAQIASGLDDRFALLVRGPRGAAARQQTLAASIDWSHDLLDVTDQVVFRRLAAFAGSFSLDAARSVCASGPIGTVDVLTSLGRLVDKSLVVMEERDDEAEPQRERRDRRFHRNLRDP